MIIANGTIQVKQKKAHGIDPVTNYPLPVEVSWSDPIPCQYTPNKYNKLGVVNGEHFTVAQYTVLIEEQAFEANQIMLIDKYGKCLGEFSIMQIEPLEAVCEIKIII